MAHEFNNILTPILAHTTLISAQLGGNDRVADSVARIEKAVLRGREVVRQIMALTTTAVAEPQRVKLNDVVAEAVALFRPTLPPHINLTFTPDADGARIQTSAAEVHQIVLNLLTNAAHAMAEAGGSLRVGIDANDRAVALSVVDSGTGMDEATRQRIFEPFFTTKDVGHGSGLGLTIVRDIASRHGAELIVESAPGQGSKFTLVFSRTGSASPSEAAASDAPGRLQHLSNARVLLVDDEQEIVGVLCEVLRMQGFAITTATTPEEAITLVSRDVTRFDAVVTDMSMPSMTGLELAGVLRALAPQLTVCLLTGYTQVSAATARAKGIAAVFEKPIDPGALGAALRDVIAAKA